MIARPLSILFVSPHRLLLRRVTKFLEVFGYHVAVATDATQARAAAETQRPDYLIIEDSVSEELKAGQAVWQLCRNIRQAATGGYTYSLLLTEATDVERLREGLEAGFDDFLAQPLVFGELLSRLRAGARVIEFERRLTEQTGLDRVTGLVDAAALSGYLSTLCDSARHAEASGNFVALLDVDFFSRIAQQFGSGTSEALLREVAELLHNAPGQPFVAAAAENQFGIVLRETSPAAAETWCQQLLGLLANHAFNARGETIHLTASCGIADLAAARTAEAVLAQAAAALRLAQASGGNCVATSEEVEREAEAWNEVAAAGKLFETTLARDVMTPCALLFSADDTLATAQALLSHTQLPAAAVVDRDGCLAGILTDENPELSRPHPAKPRSSASVRLVRHAMRTDMTKFAETTPLAELMEFFTSGEQLLAVVVRHDRPIGIVHCDALAALNERLSAEHFASGNARTTTSDYLLIPDRCLSETS